MGWTEIGTSALICAADFIRGSLPIRTPIPVMSAPVCRILRLFLLSVLAGTSVRSLHAQTEYTLDGVPTAEEEEIRWLLNRARFNGAAENALRGTSYNVPASSGPLAPHNALTLASRHHSEDLAKHDSLPDHNTVPGSLYYDAS